MPTQISDMVWARTDKAEKSRGKETSPHGSREVTGPLSAEATAWTEGPDWKYAEKTKWLGVVTQSSGRQPFGPHGQPPVGNR